MPLRPAIRTSGRTVATWCDAGTPTLVRGFVLNRFPLKVGDLRSSWQGADTDRVTLRMVLWGALVAAVSLLAFLVLNPILAAFVVILLVTGAVIVYVARDWDQHSTYEQREHARAQKRAAKWERNQAAPDRDRA